MFLKPIIIGEDDMNQLKGKKNPNSQKASKPTTTSLQTLHLGCCT